MFKQQNKLDDLLTCFICLSNLNNPHICPCCSKLCCYTCIAKWLTENRQVKSINEIQQCPHCRSSLRLQQLVNCRFLEDLVAHNNDPCPEHHAQLQYYCLTCSQPICSECAMFSKHKQHEFEHLSKVFDNRIKDVTGQIDEVSDKLTDLKQSVQVIDELVDELNRNKDERVQEIQYFTEQLLLKLETTHQSRLMVLHSQKQSITNKIIAAQSELDEIQAQVKSFQRSKTLLNADELLMKVSQINAEPEQIGGVPMNFPSEVIPQYVGGNFELMNYSSSDDIVYSDHIIHNGIKWRLKIYPRGNGGALNMFMSVFLEMDSGYSEVRRYEYKIEMINQRNGQSIMREFSSEFEGGECWGYNRFFRIDLLVKDGFLKDDCLLFRYYVRAPNYKTECLDMERFIKKLELQQTISSKKEQHSSLQKLKQEIEQYAEKLEQFEQDNEDEEEEEEHQNNHQSAMSQDSSSSSPQSEYYFDGQFEEIPLQNDQPIRRNLMQKFNSQSPKIKSPLSEYKENYI